MKDEIIENIKELFSDTSKPQSETLDELLEIKEEINMLIEALDQI